MPSGDGKKRKARWPCLSTRLHAEALAAVRALVDVQDVGVDSVTQGGTDRAARGSRGHGAEDGAGDRADGATHGTAYSARQSANSHAELGSARNPGVEGRSTGDGADGASDTAPPAPGLHVLGLAIGAVHSGWITRTPGWELGIGSGGIPHAQLS